MRLVVAAVGRLKAGPERELAERYRERVGKLCRTVGFQSIEVIEIDESRARRPEDRIAQEGAALAALMSGDHVRLALDASGQSLTSEALALRLMRWRDNGRARPEGRPNICAGSGSRMVSTVAPLAVSAATVRAVA